MHVHVVNLSTLVTDEQARTMVSAVNMQVRADFARAWGRSHDAVHFSHVKDLKDCEEAVIAIVNTPPQGEDGVLGEHTELLGDQVVGYVYVAPILDSRGGVYSVPDGGPRGCCVSATLSHEVLELIGNPSVNRWADDELGDSVAFEMCDPCEADTYGMEIVGPKGEVLEVLVSDFVLPAYFDPESDGPFDKMEVINVAFGVAPEGYQIVRDATTNERAVWGVIAPWRTRAKASRLSRTSRLTKKPRVVSVLDAVREARAHAGIALGSEPVETERAPAPSAAPAPVVPKPQRRVIVGKGGRPPAPPNRRIK